MQCSFDCRLIHTYTGLLCGVHCQNWFVTKIGRPRSPSLVWATERSAKWLVCNRSLFNVRFARGPMVVMRLVCSILTWAPAADIDDPPPPPTSPASTVIKTDHDITPIENCSNGHTGPQAAMCQLFYIPICLQKHTTRHIIWELNSVCTAQSLFYCSVYQLYQW